MDAWITDTPASERFPIYTRGNADEVGPEPFSPLGWSLTWEQGACPGVADGWCSLGGFLPGEFDYPITETFGNWGGYLYNQVSVGRVFGVRAPGGSPDIVDESFFGKNASIPPYVPDPRDEALARTVAIGETFAGIMAAIERPAYLTDFVAKVRDWVAGRPDFSALSDAELVEYGRTANYRLRPTWDVYCVVTIAATVGPGIVSAVAGQLGRPEAAVEVFSAIGGVDSAGTAERIWQLSRQVRRSPVVSAMFDDGVDDLLGRLRASDDSEVRAFVAGFDNLLTVDGHRGPNEWDILSDSWVLKPLLALGMIDQVRRQIDEQSPQHRATATAARRDQVIAELRQLVAGNGEASGMLEAGLRSGRLFYQCREAVKDASVRVMLEAKLPFHELGRRLAERGLLADPKHLFLLLDGELDDMLANSEEWRERLVARAAQFADLSTRVPPYIVVHGEPIPPITQWPLRADVGPVTRAAPGDTLTGLGVSPGVAKGRARVAFDLSEVFELEPGEIIVCSTTDPSWVPLFMIAGGVVCDIGAPASHAAIVSRELGVPCVVSVRDARRRIPNGSLIEIDGRNGTVTVIER